MELHLTPKPGLVDLEDRGSHPDLSVPIMERSLRFLHCYLGELISSLHAGEPFPSQVTIGLRCEKAMLDSLGTNTHRGYIFLSGLFLVARWRSRTDNERVLRHNISSLAGDFFNLKKHESTNGDRARSRYGTGGIIREAVEGFPSLFDEAIPAYIQALELHGCRRTASFAMMGRLMQCLEDTTTLHRRGMLGLARIRRDGRLLEEMIAAGCDCLPFLRAVNREYIRMNLTMGGVADMLGLSYACLLSSGRIKCDSSYTSPSIPMPIGESKPASLFQNNLETSIR